MHDVILPVNMHSCGDLLLILSIASLIIIFFIAGDPNCQTKKRPQTTGYQFRISVAELMKNLLSKNPNYIRCIKPNDTKEPNKYIMLISKISLWTVKN